MNPPLRPLCSLTQTPSTDSSEPVRYHVTTPLTAPGLSPDCPLGHRIPGRRYDRKHVTTPVLPPGLPHRTPSRMSPLTYRISTLGCRVNHAEARDFEAVLLSRGLQASEKGWPADIEVVHTCSVTGTAASKSRHALRQAGRRGQTKLVPQGLPSKGTPALRLNHHQAAGSSQLHPLVIATGCFASTNLSEAIELTASGDIIPHYAADGSTIIERFTQRIDQWLADIKRTPSPIRDASSTSSICNLLHLPVIKPRAPGSAHIRAELRIQDGCDAHCTFCIIPSIRKTLRSKRIADVVEETRCLIDLGHQEIVLTGIFIGAYGHETALRRNQQNRGASPLADLVDEVAQVPGLKRLRISSLEPGDVSGPLLDAMIANAPVVVPHLHLPLQSGSDNILKRMNRQYRVGEYLEMIDQVIEGLTTDRDLKPAITTDIICGFPGETDEDFQKTIHVARYVGFLHMHVFPYSAREGTAAARWRDIHLRPEIIKSRVRTLIDLENNPLDGFSIRYRQRLLGRTLRVILEQPDKSDSKLMTGRCDHYALITIPTDKPRGSLVNATITEVSPTQTRGEISPADVILPILR